MPNGETHDEKNWCDNNDTPPTDTLQIENHEGSTISRITPIAVATPVQAWEQLHPLDMGLPPTQPPRLLKIPNKALLEKGYDSDFKMDPFYEDGVEEESLVDMDEEALREISSNIQKLLEWRGG